MAREILRRGSESAPNDFSLPRDTWWEAAGKINSMTLEVYRQLGEAINAGAVEYDAATNEASITLAIAAAVSQGKTVVIIPPHMRPFDVSLVTLNGSVRLARSDGDVSRYDVQAYGADPLGVIDATASINAVPITQDTYLSQGTYLVSGTLTKTRMSGDGPTSILFLGASATLTSLQSPGTEAVLPIITNPNHTGADDTGIRFARFKVNGNSANQSHNQGMAGIYLRNVTDALLQDVEVDDIVPNSMVTHSKQSFCFMSIESDNVHIRGGRYTNSGYECIGFRNDVHHSSIIGAYSGSGGVHSIQVASGVDFGSSAVEPTNISISSNVIEHEDGRLQGAGIIVHTGDVVSIAGNSVLARHGGDSITVTGIIVDAADGVSVTGNVVTSTGVAMNPRNNPQNLTISGNYFQSFITGFTSFANSTLHMSQTTAPLLPSNVTITGNILKPPTNGIGLRLRGTKIHAADNIVVQGLRCVFVEGTTTETSDVVIVDNDLTTSTGGGCFGVQLTQNASRVRVRNNVIRAAAASSSGITLENTVDDIELTNNDTRGVTTAANRLVITTSGTNIMRRDNRLSTGAHRGRAVLVNGTVTVSTAEVQTADNITLTRVVAAGTTRGVLEVGTITAGTSFVINATDLAGVVSADDDSTVFWEIVH